MNAPATAPASSSTNARSHFGQSPTSPAVRISPELAQTVRLAADALSPDAVNQPGWNPFLNPGTTATDPIQAGMQQLMAALVGRYQSPSELFQGKVLIPVQEILSGAAAQEEAAEKAATDPAKKQRHAGAKALFSAIAAALPPLSLIRTPAHQFAIDGRSETRIVPFGGPDAEANLRAVATELGGQNMRLVCQWLHIADKHLSASIQGGTPVDIFGNEFNPPGSSHIQGYSTGQRTAVTGSGAPRIDAATGQPVIETTTVFTNWSTDAHFDGCLFNDAQKDYAAHLVAIDYQAGAHDLIPAETLAAYKKNADLWDCFASLVVPFSTADTVGYQNYFWNPLEIHSQASAVAVAKELANLDWETFSKTYGGFYCAEAQYSVANLGPQQETLITRSRFGNTALGKLIDKFNAAPGYEGKPIEWRRQNPEIGWRYLFDEGEKARAAGAFKPDIGISYGQYRALASRMFPKSSLGETDFARETYSNRQTVYLEFIPEHIKGWQAYRPKNPDGLIATPMSTAMVTRVLMNLYLPPEGITYALLSELLKAHAAAKASGNTALAGAIATLAGGTDPTSKAGHIALALASAQFANGFVLGALNQRGLMDLKDTDKKGFTPEELAQFSTVQIKLFGNCGYGEITNPADKQKVCQMWGGFMSALMDPGHWTREQLSAALEKMDAATAALEVERKSDTGHKFKGLMRFVPPGAWSFWAQYPDFCHSYAVRYVGTLVHKDIVKPAASA